MLQVCHAIAPNGPKLIILAGRTRSKLDDVPQLGKECPSVPTRVLIVDLASQKQIRQATVEVEKYSENIDVLVNNAGVMACPYEESEDGIEMHLAANYMGHFLFTNLLVRSGKLAKGARIVNVSSTANSIGGVQFGDILFSANKTPPSVYGRYRMAEAVLLTMAFARVSLAEKLGPKSILSFNCTQGAIQTSLYRYMSDEMLKGYGKRDCTIDRCHNYSSHSVGLKSKAGEWIDGNHVLRSTLDHGTATHVAVSFDPSIVDQNGSYLADYEVDMGACEEYAKDKENEVKLWTITEDTVKEKFVF